jgi:hypothetical protein
MNHHESTLHLWNNNPPGPSIKPHQLNSFQSIPILLNPQLTRRNGLPRSGLYRPPNAALAHLQHLPPSERPNPPLGRPRKQHLPRHPHAPSPGRYNHRNNQARLTSYFLRAPLPSDSQRKRPALYSGPNFTQTVFVRLAWFLLQPLWMRSSKKN